MALAENGNFVRAAECCCIGQSTLSTQIMKLEGYLGVTLFDRGQHPVCLTPIGKKIFEKAKKAISNANEIKQLASDYSNFLSGSVRLGSIPTLGPYLFPPLLSYARSRAIDIGIYPTVEFTGRLFEQLRHGRLDALLVPLPLPLQFQNYGLEITELFKEPYVIALPPNSVLMEKNQIAVEDLNSEELLVLEKSQCMHDQVLEICSHYKIKYPEERIASSIPNLLTMVSSGNGITIIPYFVTLHEDQSVYAGQVIFRPFAPPEPQRVIGLVWPKGSSHRKMLRALCDLARVSVEKWTTNEQNTKLVARWCTLNSERDNVI